MCGMREARLGNGHLDRKLCRADMRSAYVRHREQLADIARRTVTPQKFYTRQELEKLRKLA